VFIAGLTPEDVETLGDIVDTMKRACQKSDMPGIVGADIALHRYLVTRGGSAALEAVWRSIAGRIRMAYSRLNRHLDIHREHDLIVKAILDRNLPASLKALEKNLV
jgi:DNA-binding GntR family transcriptional regulator